MLHTANSVEARARKDVKIKMCLQDIRVESFSVEWERNILDLLPREGTKKYPTLIKSMLKDVKDTYTRDMQKFTLKILLRSTTKERDVLSDIYDTRNVTKRQKEPVDYERFVKCRNSLKSKYFLSLEPIRIIMNTAHFKLPCVICDFQRYREIGIVTLCDFRSIIAEDVKKGSLAITNQFYVEASKAISRARILSNVTSKQLSSIMRCVTNVFVQQILNIMIRSIDHTINAMKDGRYCPRIELRLIFQDCRLLIDPEIEDVFLSFHDIINSIENIAQDLIPLEEWLNVKTTRKYMKVKLPDWYLKESRNKLQNILNDLFHPVNEHLRRLTEEFHPVCTINLKSKILPSSAFSEKYFESCLKRVRTYDVYLTKANEMISNLYFTVGKLEQKEARESLKQRCIDVRDSFVAELIAFHKEFNVNICTEFENLKRKALNVPKDAKALIELIDYISHRSKILIKELEDKIRNSLHMLSALIEITILTDDHIALNQKTINWLHDIVPIFEQNNTLCEAMKSELEDEMQRNINLLNSRVDDIIPQLAVLDDMDDIKRIHEYVDYYRGFLKQTRQIEHEMQKINEAESLFRFPETEFPRAIELKEIIMPFYSLISIIHQWQRDNAVWMDGPFEWLDAAIIEKRTLNYSKVITEMYNTFKSRIKMDVTTNKCFKFSGIADDPDPMQQPAPLKLCWQALNNINAFKIYLPLVICMCNPALQDRHWQEMSAIRGFDLTPNAGTSLRKIIAFDLMNDIERYEAISISANRELDLHEKLSEMIKEWDRVSFKMCFNKESGGMTFVYLNDIELLLGDHLVKIEEMSASSFVKPIITIVTNFSESLERIQQIIYQWDHAVMLKLSLNSTFSYPDIESYLPEEKSLYLQATRTLLDIEKKASDTPGFKDFNDQILLESLRTANEQLEIARKGVKDYLAKKRLHFPRFFFLSDRDIRTLLFEMNNTEKMCMYLQKCFVGIKKLRVKEKYVCSIFGDYGEEVRLSNKISISNSNRSEEEWLIRLECEMRDALKKNIFQCHDSFDDERICSNIMNFPSIAIICALHIRWTSQVHACLFPTFNRSSLSALHTKSTNYLRDLLDELKSRPTRRHKNLLSSLIVVVSNQKEMIKLLLKRDITKSTDFEWIAQLRYYLNNNCIETTMFNTTIKYGYEYEYYKQSIINTALTDRCFHTLIQAYKYHLYGAIIGPSSTGKTETVKSLARALAVQFHNFNCSETISYNLLSQLLKGLISCGAWLCFENFDRLKVNVLSAITQNIVHVSQIAAMNLTSVTFDGFPLTVLPTGNICIIMNTEKSKYSNLPDNLKILFRTVSMVVPDLRRILEVELFAAGFSNAKSLAIKLAGTYRLLSEQLWCEFCKNFDLFSMKKVIITASYLKRNHPDENEDMLVLRSLIDVNIPKLCDKDVLIFKAIVHDTFPDVVLLSADYTSFLKTLETVCKARCLECHDIFKLKIIQLFESMHVHQALLLVSDPFGGKTELLYTLKETLISLHKSTYDVEMKLNFEIVLPGVVNVDQLFGYVDKKTGTWKDGLCSKIFRTFSENSSTDKQWIIFDGPLKAVWTEHLYTVLDTNRILSLTSGERINITNSTSVIFETMNISEASPTILSRCGIIYIEANSINWRTYVKSRISKHEIYKGHEKLLYTLFDWAIEPCLRFVRSNCSLNTKVGQLHLITSTLNLFEMYLQDALTDCKEEKEKTSHFTVWVQAALILSIVLGLGGNLNTESHVQFNAFCVSLWNGTMHEYQKPIEIKNFEITLPHEGLIQDNIYIFKGVGNWKPWSDLLKNEKVIEMPVCNQIFVPTINTIKYNNLLLKHIKHRKPFIFGAGVAAGKTSIMQNLLRNTLPREKYLTNFFNFTSLDSVEKARELLLSKLNKIKKRHYGPPKGQFCINFIDDLCVGIQSESVTRDILELLRQYLNHGYVYDANRPEKIFIYDTMLSLAATICKERSNVCPRVLRHFNMYTMHEPTNDAIFRVYSTILFANLKKNQFAADILNSVTNITNATVSLYNFVIETLRPTPSKFQYCFNIRDVSRVIDGCSLLHKESVETKITFIRLWVHEVWRTFGDRICDNDDRECLFTKIREIAKTHFKDSFETAFDYLPKYQDNQITKESFNDLMFGNFTDVDKVNKNKRYEEITSVDTLRNKILSCLTEYNNSFKKRIDIVVSRYVLECLVKVSRVLAIPGDNLLIISNVGSGRRSVTCLAAYMQQQKFFEPSVHSYSNTNNWRNDLKQILRECGELRKDIAFFVSGEQIKNTLCLRDVNSLLATTEIPDLFSIEDKRSIVEAVRLYAQGGNRNAEISIREVMDYFVEQCKSKLHIVLSFSPTNETFKSYLHKDSNILKHCTINWYGMWPEDALVQIGTKYMQDVNIQDHLKPYIIKACIKFYDNSRELCRQYREETGRSIHVTSSSFLHVLKLYVRLTSKKQNDIILTRKKYLAGLEKLEYAAQQVEEMKATLTVLKPKLEMSARQTMITMKEVENENISVEKATIIVKREEEVANKKAEIAGTLKTECEADLAVAIPILEDAIAALNTLKPTDITLVKAMKNPPDTVKLVMAAVCVMLNVPPDRTVDPVTGKKYTDYWGPSKRILGDMNFLQNLKEYDKDDIPPTVMQVIKKTYMTDNSFMPHIVAKASSAAEGLCKWVRAMVSYDEVAKVVAPKKEKLIAAQRECNEAEAFLNEKRRTLSALNAKLAALNNSLQETLQQKLKLEKEVESCTSKLKKAESLIASLGGEKSRWMQCAETLHTNYENLPGDMVLSCGIIAFVASYNFAFRNRILHDWQKNIEDLKIPYSKDYSFINVLGAENIINHWHFCGLPKDKFSTENAIIMTHSKLCCLFIDSQNQANLWIKKIEKKNDLTVVKLTDPDCMTLIRRNVENGKPTLIENVGEQLEIQLEPFLLKVVYKTDETWYLDTGKDVIKYSEDFRLYITTRLLNPQYSYEVFSKLTIIDFSIPNEALQDRLLDIVISKEKPELQEKFEELLVEDATNKKILSQQEDNILSTLSSTTTNILEDENAIQILDSSKTLLLNVIKKQEAANLTSAEINKFRDSYMKFVKHCAGLFSTLNALSYLNHMYRFSFSWFIQLYVRSIETSNRSVILEKRLGFLKSSFTQNLHLSVCRSLSEGHKILYSFLLCSKTLQDERKATEEEIKFFMSSNSESFDRIVNFTPNWLPNSVWNRICKISATFDVFHGLADDFRSNNEAWEKYYKSEPLRDRLIPKPWIDKLSEFQKLILVKSIRPDKIVIQILQLIASVMGDTVDYPPQIKISQSYAESSCLIPLIFILPSYSSPLSLISAYANAKGYSSKLFSLSMGEDQEQKAVSLIEKAQKEGGWVFLQNCHLTTRWMTRLEKILENSNATNVSLDFRLWLSSYPTKEFPISILLNSIKITHDYPLSVKQNLLDIYQSEPVRNKEFFEGCPGKDLIFSKLLFSLCLFHIVASERKYFGQQGWNIPYGFDHADLKISITQLRDLINDTESTPFELLLHLVGECNYGGKMMDTFDERCLNSLLRYYCNPDIIADQRYVFTNELGRLIPQRYEYFYVIKWIREMPLYLSSEIFASNENGIIIRDTRIATEFISALSRMNEIALFPDKHCVRDQVLITIADIIDKLPDLCKFHEFTMKYTTVPSEPLERVLFYEIELLKETVNAILQSLNNLKAAFDGHVQFSDSLRQFSEEIYRSKVPHTWKKYQIYSITKNLSYYVTNLSKRMHFLRSWLNQGHTRIVRFNALHSCKMFLSAVLLNFSKRYKIPVEKVEFVFEVTSENDAEDTDAYFIHGLHLSGARWNLAENMLEESLTNIFWQDMPVVRIKCTRDRETSCKTYECPVYVSPFQCNVRNIVRNIGYACNYIISIPLSTNVDPDHWTRQGTALFCHISQD